MFREDWRAIASSRRVVPPAALKIDWGAAVFTKENNHWLDLQLGLRTRLKILRTLPSFAVAVLLCSRFSSSLLLSFVVSPVRTHNLFLTHSNPHSFRPTVAGLPQQHCIAPPHRFSARASACARNIQEHSGDTMGGAPQAVPTRFPCWVKAVYSWGGEVGCRVYAARAVLTRCARPSGISVLSKET